MTPHPQPGLLQPLYAHVGARGGAVVPHTHISLGPLPTDVYRVDFQFIKVVADSLILGADVPVAAQSPQEPVLAVVGPRHRALGQVDDTLLQEVIGGVQHADELWGEGRGRGSCAKAVGGGGQEQAPQDRPALTPNVWSSARTA